MQPNREAIEALVKSLDTGTLVNALASQGVHIGQPADGQESPMWSSQKEENPQSWNNIKIDLEGRHEKTPLHSPENYLKEKLEETKMPEYVASENPPSLEPWMNAGAQG